jgi:hypothetical protein
MTNNNTPPGKAKFNLHELVARNYDNVRTRYRQDDPYADANAIGVIREAFREAAREHFVKRPGISEVLLVAGPLITGTYLITGFVGGMAGLFDIRSNDAYKVGEAAYTLSALSTFFGIVAKGVFGDNFVYERQIGKVEAGYPILPDARGNKRVFRSAQKRIDTFLAANRRYSRTVQAL